jgi:hypothetical protein
MAGRVDAKQSRHFGEGDIQSIERPRDACQSITLRPAIDWPSVKIAEFTIEFPGRPG